MRTMENREKKLAGLCLCLFLVFVSPLTVFAKNGSAGTGEQKTASWTDYFSRFFVFWEKDKSRKADEPGSSPDAWKNVPVNFSDFLPDDLPGIEEYRRAMRYRRWENRPSHTVQEVYDLFGLSARKGNVLALIRQYEMYLDNPVSTENGNGFFREQLAEACRQVYPVAVTGNPDAQYLYARYCVDFKSAQAQSWYSRAFRQYKKFADKNVPYAQYMAGEIYRAFGEEKTAQDWYFIAAKNGNADAVCRIKLNFFHENEVWKNLGSESRGGNSCAVYQALKLISQTHNNKVIAYAARQLLMQIPTGFASKGFDAGGFRFHPDKDASVIVDGFLGEDVTAAQKMKSEALVRKYKNNRAAFIDDYLDKFDWNRLSPFGD